MQPVWTGSDTLSLLGLASLGLGCISTILQHDLPRGEKILTAALLGLLTLMAVGLLGWLEYNF